MTMPLFLLLLRYNPSFCRAIAEDFEEKRPEDVVHYASNFPKPTPSERLPMPAGAIAVSSVSVSCFIMDQLKVYMSAMFEYQSKRNSTPRSNAYLPISERRRRENVCWCPLSPRLCSR